SELYLRLANFGIDLGKRYVASKWGHGLGKDGDAMAQQIATLDAEQLVEAVCMIESWPEEQRMKFYPLFKTAIESLSEEKQQRAIALRSAKQAERDAQKGALVTSAAEPDKNGDGT